MSYANIKYNGLQNPVQNPKTAANNIQPDANNKPSNNQSQQPSVRHIPIFVEGRDEPIVNKHIETPTPSAPSTDTTDGTAFRRATSPPQTDFPRSGSSLFDRVKNFPMRFGDGGNQQQRSASPGRTIPVHVQTTTGPPDKPTASQQRPLSVDPKNIQRPVSTEPKIHQPHVDVPPPSEPSAEQHFLDQQNQTINKIQQIQKDVSQLMDDVEQFNGISKKDRQYMYLDEMLTQNLLKLDTIDATGKENIKLARREAIKCINTCIAVLEAKVDMNNAASRSISDDHGSGDGKLNTPPQPQQQQSQNTNEVKKSCTPSQIN